ncbi:hypothetical protein BGZ70_001369, partial [Mortierella alpina]
RAQTLEARWQEVLLEMAASEEDDDELVDDEDAEDAEEEDESGGTEEEQEEKEQQDDARSQSSKMAATTSVTAKLNEASLATINANIKGNQQHPPTTPIPASIQGTEDGEEEEEDEHEREGGDEEEDRRRMVQARKVTSRSDNALDMYSKYKNKAERTEGDKDGTSVTDQGDQNDGLLGADATLEQMVNSDNVAHITFYIQRLKTDTVAKARNGSKFAALEGMKNVKVLQQRLDDLEGNGQEEPMEQTEGEADDSSEAKTMPAAVDVTHAKEA